MLRCCSPEAGYCGNDPIAFHAQETAEGDRLHAKALSMCYLEVKVKNPSVMHAMVSPNYAFAVSAEAKVTALGDDHPQAVGPEKAPSYEI